LFYKNMRIQSLAVKLWLQALTNRKYTNGQIRCPIKANHDS
jgi:hypothetical protein